MDSLHDENSTSVEKQQATAVRSDLDPLVTRFDQLQGITSAHWASGRFGDNRVPGPSLYWIDAIISLPDDLDSTLREEYSCIIDSSPVVDPLLSDYISGEYCTSVELDRYFSHGKFRSQVYLSRVRSELVLSTKFE
jgi:hypothetical protein